MDSKLWVYLGLWCYVRQDMESLFHLQKSAAEEKGNCVHYSFASFPHKVLYLLSVMIHHSL